MKKQTGWKMEMTLKCTTPTVRTKTYYESLSDKEKIKYSNWYYWNFILFGD